MTDCMCSEGGAGFIEKPRKEAQDGRHMELDADGGLWHLYMGSVWFYAGYAQLFGRALADFRTKSKGEVCKTCAEGDASG
jgi:hypothetical protein